jgi:hypothetical protein
MADAYTIILGNNEITNCDAALVIKGEEVFRIREEENDALTIDCDIRDQDGNRIAKIDRNSVVFAAVGFRAQLAPGQPAEVIRKATGEVMAKIERLGRRKIKVTGSFWVDGIEVVATGDGLFVGRTLISKNNFRGWGTAIKLGRGQAGLGCVARRVGA